MYLAEREGLLGPSLGLTLRAALRAFGSAPGAARRTKGSHQTSTPLIKHNAPPGGLCFIWRRERDPRPTFSTH